MILIKLLRDTIKLVLLIVAGLALGVIAVAVCLLVGALLAVLVFGSAVGFAIVFYFCLQIGVPVSGFNKKPAKEELLKTPAELQYLARQ